MTSETRQRLLQLLDALFDDRATEEEIAQIEQIVLADPRARQLYLEYTALHGTLSWDVAIGAPAAVPMPEPVHRGAPRRWTIPLVTSVAAVIAALLTVTFLPPQGAGPRPIVHVPPAPVPPEAGQGKPDAGTPSVTPEIVSGNPGTVPLQIGMKPQPVSGSPVEKPEAPQVATGPRSVPTDVASVVAVINENLSSNWKTAEVSPSARASDSEWIRRVYLDIAGHIPDVDAVEQFLADTRSDKRERLVEELLAAPDYTRHFATLWTNLLIGRSSAKPVDRAALSRFLRRQFHENRPWTETVGELIAAEGSENDNGAAGFLLAHLNNEAVPATAITSRLFLCTQVHCTQCHKHPINGTSQEEFWALNSFFQQTEVVERDTIDPVTKMKRQERALVNREAGGPTFYEDLRGVMRVAYPKLDGQEIKTDASVNRRRELARILASGDRPQLARGMVNRMWAHFFGSGFTNPVDDMGPHTPVSHPELLEQLTERFVASGYDMKQLVRWITRSSAYQLTSEFGDGNRGDTAAEGELPLFSRMYVKPLSAEQMFDSLLVATGADRSISWNDADKSRQAWLDQFYAAIDNEENGEARTFDGSFAQTVMMMNGDMIRQAVSGKPGTSLYTVLNGPGNEAEKVRRLCLTALSRQPTPKELARLVDLVRKYRRDPRQPAELALNEGLSDVLWAYLNSSEFAVNH